MTTVEQWKDMGYRARQVDTEVEVFCKVAEGGPGPLKDNTWLGWLTTSRILGRREGGRPLALGKQDGTFVHGHHTPTPLGGPHEKVIT